MNITISSVHCRCATRILFRRLGELKPKDQVIPKNVALGRRAKQRGLTHAHHRLGLAVEPQAAGQLSFFFLLKKLLFEHHSNQVWYLLEPSEKNNVLNFESQLKN